MKNFYLLYSSYLEKEAFTPQLVEQIEKEKVRCRRTNLKQVKKDGSRIYTQELLLKKYPLHKAGELTSRGFERSGTTAYKCSPQTKTTMA